MFTFEDILNPKLLQTSYYEFDSDNESLSFEYLPLDFNNTVEKKTVFEGEAFSLLLNLFEMDVNKKHISFTEIERLLFLNKGNVSINEFDLDPSDFVMTNTKEFIDSYLETYNELEREYPVLNIIFSKVWTILRYLACSNGLYEGSYQVDLDSAISAYVELHTDIYYVLSNREKMKNELLEIFNLFTEHKVKLPTSEVALIYQSYSQHRNKDLVFSELNPYIRDDRDETISSWEDIVKTLPNKLNAPLDFPICDSLTKFTRQMVQLLIHNEQSIRKCKNCKRYFVVKYSSLAEYCSRLVEGTNATCQEYASKKTYKKKQAENPLYQVFTTYYNRIYGRIRRGSLDKDSTLLDDIKLLHQEFAPKYDELSSEKERNKLIEEFTSRAESLMK